MAAAESCSTARDRVSVTRIAEVIAETLAMAIAGLRACVTLYTALLASGTPAVGAPRARDARKGGRAGRAAAAWIYRGRRG